MLIIVLLIQQGRPGMNGLKGEKGDPADVSGMMSLRVSITEPPPPSTHTGGLRMDPNPVPPFLRD